MSKPQARAAWLQGDASPMQALSAKLQELATKRGKDLQDGSAFGPGREGMVFQIAIKSEAAITPSGTGPRPMREICTSESLDGQQDRN